MEHEQSGSTDTLRANGDDVDIPVYVDYVILLCRLASTTFIIFMGSLVISTILQTRSLHNVHNILIINLMMADMIAIVLYAFQNIGMTVSYIVGVQDPFRCDVFQFSLFPIMVIMLTFIMLSVEKFIAIKYALRYKAIVTHHRVYKVIAGGWIFALLFMFTNLMYELFVDSKYDKLSRFGLCLRKPASFIDLLLNGSVSVFLAFFITITLDIYLSIRAYQMYKRIQKEEGEDKQDKLNKVLRQLKPLITLLVTILGSTTMAVIIAISYNGISITGGDPSLFRKLALSNLPYLDMSLHVVVYGVYFKKIRQPLCRRLKRMVRSFKFNKKTNSISPGQAWYGRSIQRAWM